MKLTDEEEAVVRRLEQLELANKAREAEEFLERVEDVHATVKGLIDGTVDAAELERQHQREVLRKRSKEIRKEEAAARVRNELRMGRAGKGEGKRPYTYFCRFCLVEYEVEDLRCCNRCGRELQTRAERVAELQQRVQQLKGEKQQHVSRKARWRRWLQTKKIVRSSRLVVDYAAWERWEPSTDEEEKQSEPPVTPADDANFQALEQDLQASARGRAGRRTAALRCKERGNTLFKSGDWLGALQAYEEGLEQAKDVKELWTNKCLVLLKMQQYEEAHQAATRLLEYCEIFEDGYTLSADACFKAYSRRALANRALRRFDDALADLQQAAELQPNDKQVQQLLQQTHQQVQQLQHLEHLQRLSEEKSCEAKKENPNALRQRNKLPRAQEVPEATEEDGERHLLHHQEAQQERALQPAEALCITAEAAEAGALDAAATTAAAVTLAAPPLIRETEAGTSFLAAAGEGSILSKAADAGGRGKKCKDPAEKPVAGSAIDKGEGGVALERQHKSSNTLPVGDETLIHVAGSNQPTSAATPASSPPSPHANSKEQNGGEMFFAAASRSPSSSSNAKHAAGVPEKRVASAALAAAPSTSDTSSFSRAALTRTHSILAASALAADTSAPTRAACQAALPDIQQPTKKPNGLKAVRPSPPHSLLPAVAAASPTTASNAAEALKELQRVLYPAAAAGSFVAIDPPCLTAALQLLKFLPVKLAFCCSALPQATAGASDESSKRGSNSTSSTVSCSSETVRLRSRSTAEMESRTEDEEKQGEGKCRESQSGQPQNANKTFLDICIADLRRGALRVRRQRREKAEAAATTVQISGHGPEGTAAQEEATPKNDEEAAEKKLSLPPHTGLALFPNACFPALQLLHSVCFVEEESDNTRSSDEQSSSTVKCNCRSDTTDDTSSTAAISEASNGRSHVNSNSRNSCAANDATPPWLLEVCDAAAPYLLTITSELLHLFVLDSRSTVPTTGTATATAPTAESECSRYCGCHSGYKVVSHLDYHKRSGSCAVRPQAAADTNADEKTLSADASSHCCAWGACAAALATSMSLLQQLSVAPLTRRKMAEQLQRNSDGRGVLLGIPPLLLCCSYEASGPATAAGAAAASWPFSRQDAVTRAAQDVSASSCPLLPVCSSSTQRSNRQKDTEQLAAAVLAERRLQQARRDAGAVLCNLLLEQAVLQQLLPQRQAGGKSGKNQLPPSVEDMQRQLGTKTQQQHVSRMLQQRQSSPQQLLLEDGGEDVVVGVRSVLRLLLRERLQALLQREQLLQQVEEATAALSEQLECGARPLDLLSSLWKQAVLMQQHRQRDTRTTSSRKQQDEAYPSNIARSRLKHASPLRSSDRAPHTDSSTLAAGGDCLSTQRSQRPAAVSHTEHIISALLLSTEELGELEAHAKVRATTTDRRTEDPLLEEAQQALDIITNLGRSSAGRIFVLKHLQLELLQLLAVSGDAAAEGEAPETHRDGLSRAMSVVENSQQQPFQQQQHLNAVELLRELLTPPGCSRSRSGRFVQAVDVLGLLLNLTSSSAVPGVSSRLSFAAQAQREQAASTGAEELTMLQRQLLLSGGTQLGVLPLLLPFIDRVTEEQQERLWDGQRATGPAGVHASPAGKASTAYLAGLRSLTVVSRLVAAAGAVAGQSAALVAAPTAAAFRVEESASQQEQKLQKKLLLLPAWQRWRPCAAAATHQKQVPAGAPSREANSTTITQHRDLVECLLPRILKLLTPPNKQQQPYRENQPHQQQQPPATQQQGSPEHDRAAWGELQNASLLVLCALANLSVTCLLETAAASTLATPFGASSYSTAVPASPESATGGGSTSIQEQEQQQTQQQKQEADKLQQRQKQEQAYSQCNSALQEMGKVICSWLQVLKPRGYAHQRTEMQDPVAIARGNLLLLVGHLAKAQGGALQKQLTNEQQGSAPARLMQRGAEQAQSPQQSQTQLNVTRVGRTTGGEGQEAAEVAPATPGAVAGKVADRVAAPPLNVLHRELAELDLRLCVHCCVESLRKDVEGPQRNAAIALAALARIAKYRPYIEALNGFESLMQIAAPQLLGRR